MSDKEAAPQEWRLPGTRPTRRLATVDTTESSAPAGPSTEDHDDTLEAHYASLERLECASCFGGYVTITVEEDGQEHDEAVPCRRCQRS
jgi:hypothetical protein